MSKTEALTVLVRRHRNEFKDYVGFLQEAGNSQRQAKTEAVKRLANKYQHEYVQLRGKDLKGRL